MAYASWSVTFGEQPTAAKWNILGTNDASFNDGTGIGTDAIRAASMYYGMVRNRQAGNSGDATWQSSGTTTTATDAKDVFIQVGRRTGTGSGSDVAVTFPSAYNYAPLVFATPQSAGGANVYCIVSSVTTTGFNIRQIGGSGTEEMAWIAIGQ